MSARNFPIEAPDDQPEPAFVSLDDTLCGRCRWGCVAIFARRTKQPKKGAVAVPEDDDAPETSAFSFFYRNGAQYRAEDYETVCHHLRFVRCSHPVISEAVEQGWDIVACQGYEAKEVDDGHE